MSLPIENLIKALVIRWSYAVLETKEIKERYTTANIKKMLRETGINESEEYLTKIIKEAIKEYNEVDISDLLEKYPLDIQEENESKENKDNEEDADMKEITEEIEELELKETPAEKDMEKIIYEVLLKYIKENGTDEVSVTDVIKILNKEHGFNLEKKTDEYKKAKKIIKNTYELLTEDIQSEDDSSANGAEGDKAVEEIAEQIEELEISKDVPSDSEKIEEESPLAIKGEEEQGDKEEKKVKKQRRSKEGRSRLSEIRDKIEKREMNITEDMIKINLPYYAALSYYITDKTIPINDPMLEDFFFTFNRINAGFKESLNRLNPVDRIEFITKIFKNKKIPSILEDITTGINTVDGLITVALINYERQFVNCKKVMERIEKEVKYNLMYHINNVELTDDMDKLTDRLIQSVIKKIRCGIENEREVEKYMKDVVETLYSSSGKGGVEIAAKEYQLKNINEYLESTNSVYVKTSEDEQYDIQMLYNQYYPELIPSLRFRYLDDDKVPIGKTNIFFFLDPATQSDLSFLNRVFNSATYRTKLIKAIELIEKSLTVENKYNESEQRRILESLKNNGSIEQQAYNFITIYMNYYGGMNSIPTSTQGKKKLDYNNIEDLPERLQAEVVNRSRAAFQQSAEELRKKKLLKNMNEKALIDLQIELGNKEIDVGKVSQLIDTLNVSNEYKSKMLYMVKEGEFNNIYLILEQAKVGERLLKNPLIYRGINRARRLKKLEESRTYGETAVSKLPHVSYPFKECMMWHFLMPWMSYNPEFSKIFKTKNVLYFIADPSSRTREELNDREKLYYGMTEVFNIMYSEGRVKYTAYPPTNYFWKVHCATMHNNGQCKVNDMKLKLTTSGGYSQEFVYGIYNGDTKEYYIYKEEDFDKECEWFNKHASDKLNFYSFSKISINKDRRLNSIVRELGLNIIEGVLTDLYKLNNITNSALVKYNAKKLENKIYEHLEVDDQVPIFLYFKNIHLILFLVDPSELLYHVAPYFTNLFLKTNVNKYQHLLNLNVSERIPELYTLSAEDKTNFLAYYDNITDVYTNKDIIQIYNTMDPTRKASTQRYASVLIEPRIRAETILSGINAEALRNKCVNSVEGNVDFVVSLENGEFYCLNIEDINGIRNDIDTTVPENVKNKVLKIFKKGEFDPISRFGNISDYIDKLAYDNLIDYVQVFNIKTLEETYLFDNLNKEQTELFKSIISTLETALNTKIVKSEYNLILDHLIGSIIKEVITNLELELNKIYLFEENVDMAYTLNKLELELPINYTTSIKKLINKYVDEFNRSKLKLEKGEDVMYKTYNCAKCSKAFSNPLWKSYYSSEEAAFCSKDCLSMFDEKKEVKKIETLYEAVIYNLLRPLLTVEELKDLANKYKVDISTYSLDDIVNYNKVYGLILKGGYTIPTDKLENEKQRIELLAEHYKVNKELTVSQIWNELNKNEEFKKDYNKAIEKYIGGYIVKKGGVKESIKPSDSHIVEIEAPVERSLDKIESFSKSVAEKYADKLSEFDFKRDLYTPFLKENNLNIREGVIENYEKIENVMELLNSYGRALKSIKDENNIKELLEYTSTDYREFLANKYLRGRKIVEDGKEKFVKFDKKEDAYNFIDERMKNVPITEYSILESIAVLINTGNKKIVDFNLDPKEILTQYFISEGYTKENAGEVANNLTVEEIRGYQSVIDKYAINTLSKTLLKDFITSKDISLAEYILKKVNSPLLDIIYQDISIQELLRRLADEFIKNIKDLEKYKAITQELTKPVQAVEKVVLLEGGEKPYEYKEEKFVRVKRKLQPSTTIIPVEPKAKKGLSLKEKLAAKKGGKVETVISESDIVEVPKMSEGLEEMKEKDIKKMFGKLYQPKKREVEDKEKIEEIAKMIMRAKEQKTSNKAEFEELIDILSDKNEEELDEIMTNLYFIDEEGGESIDDLLSKYKSVAHERSEKKDEEKISEELEKALMEDTGEEMEESLDEPEYGEMIISDDDAEMEEYY